MKIRHESRLHHPQTVQNRLETAIHGLHSAFDIPNSSFLRPSLPPDPITARRPEPTWLPQKQFPSSPPKFGVHLGAIAPQGERNTLIVSLDALARMSCNPFYPLVMKKIEAVIPSWDDDASPAGSHSK